MFFPSITKSWFSQRANKEELVSWSHTYQGWPMPWSPSPCHSKTMPFLLSWIWLTSPKTLNKKDQIKRGNDILFERTSALSLVDVRQWPFMTHKRTYKLSNVKSHTHSNILSFKVVQFGIWAARAVTPSNTQEYCTSSDPSLSQSVLHAKNHDTKFAAICCRKTAYHKFCRAHFVRNTPPSAKSIPYNL